MKTYKTKTIVDNILWETHKEEVIKKNYHYLINKIIEENQIDKIFKTEIKHNQYNVEVSAESIIHDYLTAIAGLKEDLHKIKDVINEYLPDHVKLREIQKINNTIIDTHFSHINHNANSDANSTADCHNYNSPCHNNVLKYLEKYKDELTNTGNLEEWENIVNQLKGKQ